MDKNKISFYEWELFNWPIEVYDLKLEKGFYTIPDKSIIKIERGYEYKFVGTLFAETNKNFNFNHKNSKPPYSLGSFLGVVCTPKTGMTKYIHFRRMSR